MGFEYPAFLVATLSFNKFVITRAGMNSVTMKCLVCEASEAAIWHRLDHIIEWAEQHDCPIEFRAPTRDKET